MPNLVKNLKISCKDVFKDKILITLLVIIAVVAVNQIVFSFILVGRDMASAATVYFNENFTTTTYRDVATTTGLWDPTISTNATLYGGNWSNMAETLTHRTGLTGPAPYAADDLSNNTLGLTSFIIREVQLDSNGYPHIVGESQVTNEVYYSRWSPSTGWTGADGIDDDADPTTNDLDNVSQTGGISQLPRFVLKTGNVPLVVWEEGAWGSEEIYFAQFALGGWQGFSGSPDDISGTPGTPSIDPEIIYDNVIGRIYIIWTEGVSGSLNFSMGIPAGAGGSWNDLAAGGPGKEALSGIGGLSGANDSVYAKYFEIDTAGNVWGAWAEETLGGPPAWDVFVAKGVPGGAWTWADGVTPGAENVTGTAASLSDSIVAGFKIDSGNNPNLLWFEGATPAYTPPTRGASRGTGTAPIVVGQSQFVKWTPGGVCGGPAACWTAMNGLVTTPDNVSHVANSQYASMVLDPNDIVYVAYSDVSDIFIAKGNPVAGPSAWSDMNFSGATYENVSNAGTASTYPILLLDPISNFPYILWNDNGPIAIARWGFPVGNSIGNWYNLENKLISTLGYTQWGFGPYDSIYPKNWPLAVTIDSQGYIMGGKTPYFTKWLPYYNTATIQSLDVNTGALTVDQVEFNITETITGTTFQAISYALSNDGGASWEAVTTGTTHVFATPGGTDLRWQATMTSDHFLCSNIASPPTCVYSDTTCGDGSPTGSYYIGSGCASTADIAPIVDLPPCSVDSVSLGIVVPDNVRSGGGGAANPNSPAELSCQVLSGNTIRWSFEDTASNESGFRLYGPSGLIWDSGPNVVMDLSYIDETGLLPNVLYADRYVTTYSGSGESAPSNLASCTTLAGGDPLPSPEITALPENIEVGDVLQGLNSAEIYLISSVNQKRLFPTEVIYNSWYSDYSIVKQVSEETLSEIALGPNMILRPGTWLMKITTDPKVYAVEPNGVIRWIETEAVALSLYGVDWNQRIIDMPDVYFVDYVEGNSITTSQYTTGSLLQYKGTADIYYIENGSRRLVSPQAFTQNYFQQQFVITNVPAAKFELTEGSAWPVDYDYTMTMTQKNRSRIRR
ncbi:hypothetical protein ACFL2U_00930 [Patescibacteria group bacterium]